MNSMIQSPVIDRAATTEATQKPGKAKRSKRQHERRRDKMLSVLGVVLFFVGWHLVSISPLVNPAFFSGPVDVANELVRLFSTGEIWPDIATTGIEFGVGLALAIGIGVGYGMLYGASSHLRALTSPIVFAWNATPQVALIPVLVLWFGIGLQSKVVSVVLACLTLLILNTASGIQTREEKYVKLARSFGASRWQMMWTVSLPHALPYIVTGIRLAIGKALIILVVAELLASRAGLGHRLGLATNAFDTAQVFAVIIITATIGVIFAAALNLIEKRLASWRS